MILVLNCGSQSIKWKVFDKDLNLKREGGCIVLDQNNFQKLLIEEIKKINGLQINMIGHRVVHGGRTFVKTTKITDKNLKELFYMYLTFRIFFAPFSITFAFK
jgi:acetate kinase